MTEKEEVEETTEELEETLDPEIKEEEPAADEIALGVEEEEEPEAKEVEPTDDRGVPLKNRIAELERKLSASGVREDSYKDLLTNLNKTREKETTTTDVLQSLTHAEFAEANMDKTTADFLLKAFNREIDIRIAGADRQNKANTVTNQEFYANRIDAIKDIQAGLDGEFGDLVVDDGQGGIRYDGESKLFKRAKEIFERSPKLQQLAQGPAIAAQKAEVELIKEKYGKGKSKKSSKAEKMKGSSSGRGGGDAQAVKVGGKFHRVLSDDEYDKLPRDEKDDYDLWESTERNK